MTLTYTFQRGANILVIVLADRGPACFSSIGEEDRCACFTHLWGLNALDWVSNAAGCDQLLVAGNGVPE